MNDLLLIGGATPDMLDRLNERFNIHTLYDHSDQQTFLADYGEQITHVLTNGHDGIKPDTMAALPNLAAISCYGVGYDAIDSDAAAVRGIPVTHTPNVLNAEVATTALMLTLACFRNFRADEALARSGNWETDGNAPLSRSADNRRIGILGLGRIGQAIADKFAPFNPELVYHSRNQKDVPYRYFGSLVEMADYVDVLICITPGGASTNKMVNAEVMDALGPEGILVNVARGSVVDETALIAALQEGRLGWAGLDVFESEPHIPKALRDLPNTVLTPHVASGTVETRRAMGNLAVDNLLLHAAEGRVISPVPESKSVAKL